MAATYRLTNMFFASTKELAEQLRVTPATILRWAAEDDQLAETCMRVNRRRLLWDKAAFLDRIKARGPQPEGAAK
jgi:hypothetical protein